MPDIIACPERLQELYDLQLMDTPPEEAFDRLTRIASAMLKAPISLVVIVNKERQFFKSSVGWPKDTPEPPLEISFCQIVVETGEKLVVRDAKEGFAENPLVACGALGSYLGIPLITSKQFCLGSLCVVDSKARNWSEEDIAVLEDLTQAAVSEIELRRAAKLEQSRREALEAANEQLQEAIRLKGDFVAMAGHELRTPLTSISGFAKTMLSLDEKLDKETKMSMLQIIDEQSERLTKLVNNMLLSARFESGKFDVDPKSLDVRSIIEDTLRETSLEADVLCGPDLMIHADADHVKQILINFVTNAQKYGDGQILVEAEKMVDDRVKISVKDEGPGISHEFVPQLFDKFTRATSVSGGTGLGLAIVKSIAEANGGTVGYLPNKPKGSCFYVILPTAQSSVQDLAA